MKKSMLVVCLVAAFAVTGCASYGNSAAADQKTVGQIQKGKSTKADVERIMGKPNQGSFEDGRSVWFYQNINVSGMALVPFASLLTNTMDEQNVTIYFDKTDVVEAVEVGGSKL